MASQSPALKSHEMPEKQKEHEVLVVKVTSQNVVFVTVLLLSLPSLQTLNSEPFSPFVRKEHTEWKKQNKTNLFFKHYNSNNSVTK